ncbi:hypothetical protein, partial [Cupriavidus sp. AcVe19-6a]|uniref:hypothetical protein n=1 Tax=Cupriavidus sp. AcVe19-6a TaxID=2821358 RepID=UPI001AE4C881
AHHVTHCGKRRCLDGGTGRDSHIATFALGQATLRIWQRRTVSDFLTLLVSDCAHFFVRKANSDTAYP